MTHRFLLSGKSVYRVEEARLASRNQSRQVVGVGYSSGWLKDLEINLAVDHHASCMFAPNPDAKTKAMERLVERRPDELLSALYDLTPEEFKLVEAAAK
ncbi:MAG: hypothetical protein HY298_02865 [Verrucomicrobia bacterium]|nr:hypothetical protein [Verrucomicrobiota bacterium]